MDIKVLIIEDEMIIARFIEQHLHAFYDNLSITIALSVEEVEQVITEIKPHLVLCDIELQDSKDGIELMAEYRNTYSFALIFITSYQSKTVMDKAFNLAPENYIIKPLDESRLYAGTHATIQRILKNGNTETPPGIELLSESDIQVLKLIAQRYTTKEIAAQLYLSPFTVKNTRHRICRKLLLEEENNALLSWALKNRNYL